MKRPLIILFLLAPFLTYSQCNTPKTKVKVINAYNVFTDKGKPIQKGKSITIDRFLPEKPNSQLFECNKLVFKKNGELKFRYSGESIIRTLNYYDYIRKPVMARLASGNANTRGDETGDCPFEVNTLHPLKGGKKSIENLSCLKAYFSGGIFWLFNNDTIKIDTGLIESVIIFNDDSELLVNVVGDQIVMNPEVFPEENHYMIGYVKDGEKYMLTETYFFNLRKIAGRLNQTPLNSSDKSQIWRENYFHSLLQENDYQLNNEIQKIINQLIY